MNLMPLARFERSLAKKDKLPSKEEDDRVEIWVEIGKTTRHHYKGKVFRAELQTRLFGKSIRVEAVAEDLRSAVVQAKNKLKREIIQQKELIRGR